MTDLIQRVMKERGLTFPEAVRYLWARRNATVVRTNTVAQLMAREHVADVMAETYGANVIQFRKP